MNKEPRVVCTKCGKTIERADAIVAVMTIEGINYNCRQCVYRAEDTDSMSLLEMDNKLYSLDQKLELLHKEIRELAHARLLKSRQEEY